MISPYIKYYINNTKIIRFFIGLSVIVLSYVVAMSSLLDTSQRYMLLFRDDSLITFFYNNEISNDVFSSKIEDLSSFLEILNRQEDDYLTMLKNLSSENKGLSQHSTIKISSNQYCNYISGIIYNNFYVDTIRSGIPIKIVSQSIKLFSNRINFRTMLRKGDKFEFVFQESRLMYVRIIRNKQIFELFFYQELDDFFFENAEYANRDMFGLPLKSETMITSGFGYRVHPINKNRSFHSGVDYSAKKGTPVYAMSSGKITKASNNGGYGNFISIMHEQNYQTRYAHLDEIIVKKDQFVKKGECIGFVGSTGKSTGPHLHVEVLHNNQFVDPQKIKILPSKKISTKNMQHFLSELSKIRDKIAESL